MKLWKAVMTWETAPPLGRLPIAIARAAFSGVLAGPVIGLVLLLAIKPEQIGMLAKPKWWLMSCLMGAIFAASFYSTCSLPQTYITPLVSGWPLRRNRVLRALMGAAGAMAGLLLAFFLLQNVAGMTIANINNLNTLLVFEAVLGAVIALLIGAWVQRDLREKQLLAAAATAQSKALQAQINPHFFFNTLNTIQSLVDTEPRQAKHVIGRLSSMFRYSMHSSLQQVVRFSEELSFVRDYLQIETARFGDRLRYTLPEIEYDFDVPGMVLQPLVENAIRHGIAKLVDGGEVRVAVASDSMNHIIAVENTTIDANLDNGKLFQSGHALDNIRQRLDLMYSGRATLVARQKERLVEVTLVIPR
jgi:two-component sensor histidine kinase